MTPGARLLSLVRELREGGARLGVSEVQDCLELLRLAGPEELATALECTLAKSPRELQILRELLYLHGMEVAKEKERKTPGEGLYPGEGLAGTVAESGGRGLGKSPLGGQRPGLEEAILDGNPEAMQAALELGLAAMEPLGQEDLAAPEALLRRAMVTLGWFMVEHRLAVLGKGRETEWLLWKERLDSLKQKLRLELAGALYRRYGRKGLQSFLQEARLEERPFAGLNEDQTGEIQRRIAAWGKRLATRRSLRLEAGKGRFTSLRRTVQLSLATGGIPLRLARRRRAVRRPELALLCDVSPSVERYSSFILQLAYTLERRFRRVRSFLFVDAVDEVTEQFRGKEPLEAIRSVWREARSTVSGVSDYGRVFYSFNAHHLEDLPRQTVVLVLGDARNNWRQPCEEELARLAARVERLYWLNPQPRSEWGKGDSVMPLYAPYCRKVLECGNLRQLEDAAREIL